MSGNYTTRILDHVNESANCLTYFWKSRFWFGNTLYVLPALQVCNKLMCLYTAAVYTNILFMIYVVFLFLFHKALVGISAFLFYTVGLSIYYMVDVMFFASNVCSISPVKCNIALEYDLEIIFRLGITLLVLYSPIHTPMYEWKNYFELVKIILHRMLHHSYCTIPSWNIRQWM